MQRLPARISVVIEKVAQAGFVPMFAWLGHTFLAAANVVSVLVWVVAAVANRRGSAGGPEGGLAGHFREHVSQSAEAR